MHRSIEHVLGRLLGSGLASSTTVRGCTESEVAVVESRLDLRLPAVYRDFLLTMGRAAGEFLVGSDYSFPKLLTFRDAAAKLLHRWNSLFALSSAAVVFLFHQGHTFLFFDTQANLDDPPVFMFTETESGVQQVFDSFSAWLIAALEDDIAILKELSDEE
jgi:hypothetical protein